MKVWERMLMKDFQVAVPIPASEADEEESLRQPSEGEDNVARWKRVAKLAVLRSANHRWSQVVNSALKSSQIGRSTTKASLRSQLSLKRAMEEAQRSSNKSPLPPVSPVELPESTASTILHVLRDVDADSSPRDTLPDHLRPTIVVDSDEELDKTKPVTSMGYVDEKPAKIAPPVPLRTPLKVVKRKSGSPTTLVCQQSTEAPSTMSSNTASTKIPSSSPSRNTGTESTLSPPTDTRTIKSRLKPALSPKKGSHKPEDKEKLVDIMPKSPRVSTGRSPRKGGWL